MPSSEYQILVNRAPILTLFVFSLLMAVIDWPNSVAAGDAEDCAFAEQLLKTDPSKAVSACHRLAELGDAQAQYRVGEMHRRGQGVPKDFAKALEWYHRAAEQGLPEAQHCLGFAYLYGQDSPPDPVLAYMWFSLAATGGIKSDHNVLDQLAASMTPEQIAEAQRLAHEWKPKPEQP